ncbi:MAG: hypothetical protein MUE97_07195 [Phycisphaerales bacterium]|nr:hypothetical protein [Phycisphaerales bacterium]
MAHDQLIEKFFETLITGNRPRARAMVNGLAADHGWSSRQIITDLFWPTYELIDRLYRADQLSKLSHHTATRLLRVLVDQNALSLERSECSNRRVMAFCGPQEADEMGAQMAVDLLEASGFTVTFGGGGIANDEILAMANDAKPDIILVFASAASDLPNIRILIDTIRGVDACPNVQFAVGAGVFNRAEGLAEEIGADVWATGPMEMVDVLVAQPTRRSPSAARTAARRAARRAAESRSSKTAEANALIEPAAEATTPKAEAD